MGVKKKPNVKSEVIEIERWKEFWRLTTFSDGDGEICVAIDITDKEKKNGA